VEVHRVSKNETAIMRNDSPSEVIEFLLSTRVDGNQILGRLR